MSRSQVSPGEVEAELAEPCARARQPQLRVGKEAVSAGLGVRTD